MLFAVIRQSRPGPAGGLRCPSGTLEILAVLASRRDGAAAERLFISLFGPVFVEDYLLIFILCAGLLAKA